MVSSRLKGGLERVHYVGVLWVNLLPVRLKSLRISTFYSSTFSLPKRLWSLNLHNRHQASSKKSVKVTNADPMQYFWRNFWPLQKIGKYQTDFLVHILPRVETNDPCWLGHCQLRSPSARIVPTLMMESSTQSQFPSFPIHQRRGLYWYNWCQLRWGGFDLDSKSDAGNSSGGRILVSYNQLVISMQVQNSEASNKVANCNQLKSW